MLRFLNIIKPDEHGYLDKNVLPPLPLKPGKYWIAVPSCISNVYFEVTPEGTLTYPPDLDGCLKVSNGTTLVVNGLPVRLDARYVGMDGAKGVILFGMTKKDWIVHKSVHLLPGSNYHVEQGSATVSNFIFALGKNGAFDYDPIHDQSNGGFLGGLGTSTLILRGYPFLVDATHVSESVGFFNVTGLPFAHNGVQFANLLPASFVIGFGPDVSKRARVLVNHDGTAAQPQGDLYLLSQDTFHGVPRLTITEK